MADEQETTPVNQDGEENLDNGSTDADKKETEPQVTEVIAKLVKAVEKQSEDNKKIWEALKKQTDGVSYKIREFEKRLNQQPSAPASPPKDELDDFGFSEEDEEKKIEEVAEKIVAKQNQKRSEYYVNLARQKLIKYIREKGYDVDLTDDYAWQEFISGVRGADNPKERPLYTHRQDPISGCYLDVESPFKDMLEHFYIRYPEYRDSGENNNKSSSSAGGERSIDTTPSSDTTKESRKSVRLTEIEKRAAAKLGMTEEEYWEKKKELEEQELKQTPL